MNKLNFYVYGVCCFASFFSSFIALRYLVKLGGNAFRSTIHFVTCSFLVWSVLLSLTGGLFQVSLILLLKEQSETANLGMDYDHNVQYKGCHTLKFMHGHFRLANISLALLLLENILYVLSAYWIFLVTRELYKLALATIDRGQECERAVIHNYIKTAIVLIIVFTLSSVISVVLEERSNRNFQWVLLTQQICIVLSVICAASSMVILKYKGRTIEHVHGVQSTSPIYHRLKLILIVYTVFTLPHSVLELVRVGSGYQTFQTVPEIFVLTACILYCLFGAALSVVISASQACCLNMMRPFLPHHVCELPEFHNIMQASHSTVTGMSSKCQEDSEPVEAPNPPVFVFTDIENSSKLWAKGSDDVIDEAIQIHDTVIRSILIKFHGYEITTAGDAFQLAFHSIEDAVNYCFEVQMKLVRAKWPHKLDGLIPATRTERTLSWKRSTIFRGLRVRMGIHDANEVCEGRVVMQQHPVTGKMIYIGASEMIAQEIGDVGYGGEILVSSRVANYVSQYPSKVNSVCGPSFHSTCDVSALGLSVKLYQILPKELCGRRRLFDKRKGKDICPMAQSTEQLRAEEATSGTSVQTPRGSTVDYCLQSWPADGTRSKQKDITGYKVFDVRGVAEKMQVNTNSWHTDTHTTKSCFK
uniref:Uncharacterized protein AlNc14C209G8877 n=1 Tax=Albugo laibachii Nc14 TaxID=890382 RepID=F0WR69_9STRA|nr:conserved hypothetical protein [Albugo laibachii Nc14]|eukprot:CCA23830.1 conserved hypothetical protein [Albugo laibachii Nc14]